MTITLENIQDHLPGYLSRQQQEELVKQLKNFEKNNYYTILYDYELLQGDGWSNLEIINFDTGSHKKIKGILLSNSCDISQSNPRDFPPRVVFAPLVALDSYINIIKEAGTLDNNQVNNKVDAIRRQCVTSLFFLPSGGGLDRDYIAILDDLHNVPLATFLKEQDRKKLFTLNQMGFYLFLLKLSIHFCRFQEGIGRQSCAPSNAGVPPIPSPPPA